jgi:hypothetical protein
MEDASGRSARASQSDALEHTAGTSTAEGEIEGTQPPEPADAQVEASAAETAQAAGERPIDVAAAAAAAAAAVENARNFHAAFSADPGVTDTGDDLVSRGEHFEPWHREVRGVWELVSVTDADEDFIPGGATRRLIGIDPVQRELNAYMATGGRSREWQSLAFEAAFRKAQVEIRPLADRPSALGEHSGLHPAAVEVPCETAWAREGRFLHLAGGVYAPGDPEEVVQIMEAPDVTPTPTTPLAGPLDHGAGGASAASPTVDFFGVQSHGRFVAYILDVSRSMRGRMARLQGELEASLTSLPRNARFVVLPFNSTLLKLQPQWTLASQGNTRRVGRALADVAAGGGTDPAEAFEWAFRTLDPRPDEIYFMTDGAVEESRQLLKRLRTLNAGSGKTRIHAIGLGLNAEIGFLKAVAGDHGGRFVHVTQ